MTETKSSSPSGIRIVFFGTPEFAVASLRKLVDEGMNVVAVVTAPDKPAGRSHKLLQSDVKKYALEANIPILQPTNLKSREFQDELRSYRADLFIVIAFRMLPEAVWSMPPLGTFNLHASLLPKYRGAAPINRAIMNGETRTGVTAFFIDRDIDTGDMFAREETDILPSDDAGTLHDRLMEIGARMIREAVGKIARGEACRVPQIDSEATPAPKIFHEDCMISWHEPTIKIHNHIRGLSPYPAARAIIMNDRGEEKECKIFTSTPTSSDTCLAPGEIIVSAGRLIAGTADGAIEITALQPAGKKRMTAGEFLRGYKPLRFKA